MPIKAALLSELNRIGASANGEFGQRGVRKTLLKVEIGQDVKPADAGGTRLYR